MALSSANYCSTRPWEFAAEEILLFSRCMDQLWHPSGPLPRAFIRFACVGEFPLRYKKMPIPYGHSSRILCHKFVDNICFISATQALHGKNVCARPSDS